MNHIKLFEAFHGKTPDIMTYMEAENALSTRAGFAIVGVTGNVEDVERVAKKFIAGTELPESMFDDIAVVITDQSSQKVSAWKSDVLIPLKERRLEDTKAVLIHHIGDAYKLQAGLEKISNYLKRESATTLEEYWGKNNN
jgi:hypothetical protein